VTQISWARLVAWWRSIEDEDPGAWHTSVPVEKPEPIGDERLREQVTQATRVAGQSPDPWARRNQWRQTS
jgi:hypothetical protein